MARRCEQLPTPLVAAVCRGPAARNHLAGMTDRRPIPLSEYRRRACGAIEEHPRPTDSAAHGPRDACGGEVRERFSRVGVRYHGWRFPCTVALVWDRLTMMRSRVGQAVARPPNGPTA
jgi:predicted nucleic acid-binding Zn ribbon protein